MADDSDVPTGAETEANVLRKRRRGGPFVVGRSALGDAYLSSSVRPVTGRGEAEITEVTSSRVLPIPDAQNEADNGAAETETEATEAVEGNQVVELEGLSMTSTFGEGAISIESVSNNPAAVVFDLYAVAQAATGAAEALQEVARLVQFDPPFLASLSGHNNPPPDILFDEGRRSDLMGSLTTFKRLQDPAPIPNVELRRAADFVRSGVQSLGAWIGPILAKLGEDYMEGFGKKMGERTAELLTSKALWAAAILHFTGALQQLLKLIENIV